MDLYTLIVVGDERSPVRRFQVPKVTVHRGAAIAAVLAIALAAGGWDYWRLRAENSELPELRDATTTQAEKIRSFERALSDVESQLARVQELERKVRIIANLPGASATGGDDISDVAPADEPALPTGVPIEMGQGGPEPGEAMFDAAELAAQGAVALSFDQMHLRAEHLGGLAQYRATALDELVEQLEDKRNQLESMPSVWPVKGWLTSRFGPRISPFTGRRHMHQGIDIATRHGTPIVAPARGRVVFTGQKGPLGKCVVIDHGFGVRTFYGHTSSVDVKTGDRVERGQVIAAVGSTGWSTGPHLHYSVEVSGKSRDPLDYILD